MYIGLCKKKDKIPDWGEWTFQRKVDGARCIVVEGELFNRDENKIGRNITDKFPEIEPPENFVLDGEIESPGGYGKVVGRQNTEGDFSIRAKAKSCPATLRVFDIMRAGDTDTRELPLKDRIDILEVAEDKFGDNVETLPFYDDGQELWEKAVENDWEGIVAKQLDKTYPKGRQSYWRKIKNWTEEAFPVVKYEETKKGGFVIHIPVEGGTQRIVVNDVAEQSKIKKRIDDGENLEAEIQYLEKNGDGVLRHISYQGLV